MAAFAERMIRIHLPPAVSLQNAAKRLDTGKLSSEENQNILICVKPVTFRRRCQGYICQS